MVKLDEESFNQLFPVGTAVRYYPVAGRSEFIETQTRSECWSLGSGELVVLIKGRTGGVSIHHLVKI